MRFTEFEALTRLFEEVEMLKKHVAVLRSGTASDWDVGNSTQHLPFCVAGVSVALDRLIETKHNEFRQIVKTEKERLEKKNVIAEGVAKK